MARLSEIPTKLSSIEVRIYYLEYMQSSPASIGHDITYATASVRATACMQQHAWPMLQQEGFNKLVVDSRTSTMASLAPTEGNSVLAVSSSGSKVSRSSQASVSASSAVSGSVVEML